jgi:hypothetical protein
VTTSTAPEPLRVRSVLFAGTGVDPVTALAQSMDAAGVAAAVLRSVGALSRAAQHELKRQLAVVAGDVLDLDVVDLVVGGWRKQAALVAAAKRTLTVPGSEEVVDLVSHRIRSVHRPYVAMLVDGAEVARIDFELIVVLDITALVGVVRAGKLMALRGGQCELVATLNCKVVATLAAKGILLAQQRKQLDLNAHLPLGAGIELAVGDADPSSPAKAPTAWSPDSR